MPARAKRDPESIHESPAQATRATNSTAEPPAQAKNAAKTNGRTPAQADLETIKTLGELLDDLERVRIANGNRIGALERTYGEALPHLEVIQQQVKAAEHLAELELVRAWRRHPLAPWAKAQRGVGEKSIARLIAIIGDPGERPNVAKLWAYCGHGDPHRKRHRGMTQEEALRLGNPSAKKQTWLIATSLLKAGNREQYDRARERYKDRLHVTACVRCGPSGKPAPPGSEWSDGHKHAAALRYLGKCFLRDLWVAARHPIIETHGSGRGRLNSDEQG